jgi:hypothetical protein
MMVSYTRARGEGLGLKLDGGMMQRAERIALVVIGTLIAAWFAAGGALLYARAALGWTLLLVGTASSVTAVGRWMEGYRMLIAREPAAPQVPSVAQVSDARRTGRTERPREARIEEKPMRITSQREHTA